MHADLYLAPREFSREAIRRTLPDLRDLLSAHFVRQGYLFGSVLGSQTEPMNDLDIAVLPPVGLDDWFGYYNALHGDLCRLFQADNIDLVLLDQAPLRIQAQVVESGRRLLAANEAALDWEENVWSRYADLRHWHKENWTITRELAHRGIGKELNLIDGSKVERTVDLIRGVVDELRSLKLEAIDPDSFEADRQVRALSKHFMRIAIEGALDLGRHVIVRTGLGTPKEYRDIGRILGENGVLPPDLSEKVQEMGGMRNVLVHLYWDIDYHRLHNTIVEDLDVFENFVRRLFEYMDHLE